MPAPQQPSPSSNPVSTPGAATSKKPRLRSRAKPVVTINPLFKLLLWINAGLCLVTFGGMVTLAITATKEMTRAQEQLATACETVFKMTAGAFIGLLGGRLAGPGRLRETAAPHVPPP